MTTPSRPTSKSRKPHHTPVSAAVIVRNEARLLEPCLKALAWCDEVIVLDMRSTDGSRDIATRYADRVYEIEPYPIAEPARLFAAAQARYDWILLIDPDEHMPATLAEEIQRTLAAHPNAGALRLPWLFYFKGKRVRGTVWGSDNLSKWMLIHRRRVQLLPLCNQLGRTLEGFDEITLPATAENHIRHHWCRSYRQLLKRHLLRYAGLEAKKLHEAGQRFHLRHALVHPIRELNRSLRHFDGWRHGPRGWALSAIFFLYTLAYCWRLLGYTLRPPKPATGNTEHDAPTVVGQLVHHRHRDPDTPHDQAATPAPRRAA